MSDKGIISLSNKELVSNAEYNTSLETMELIDENVEVIIITPANTQVSHLVLLPEFIRMNVQRGKFKNPYTRNEVEFSEEDSERLYSMRKELIKTLKTVPHEIFVKFVRALESAHENNVELIYFPEIIKIFQVLLGAIPFFEQIEETLGDNENISAMIKEVENSVSNAVNIFENDVVDEENVKKNIEYIGFLTIPILL